MQMFHKGGEAISKINSDAIMHHLHQRVTDRQKVKSHILLMINKLMMTDLLAIGANAKKRDASPHLAY